MSNSELRNRILPYIDLFDTAIKNLIDAGLPCSIVAIERDRLIKICEDLNN